MRKGLVSDLRFIIGLYFAASSSIVIYQGLVNGPLTLSPDNLNLAAGTAMAAFGIFMIAISLIPLAPAHPKQ